MNSTVYDELDGDTSMYRCTRIADFYRALANYENKSILDPGVQASLREIKGFVQYCNNNWVLSFLLYWVRVPGGLAVYVVAEWRSVAEHCHSCCYTKWVVGLSITRRTVKFCINDSVSIQWKSEAPLIWRTMNLLRGNQKISQSLFLMRPKE